MLVKGGEGEGGIIIAAHMSRLFSRLGKKMRSLSFVFVFLTASTVLILPSTSSLPAKQLAPLAYRPLQLGSIVPNGWMRSQLAAQQSGLCGRGWLGGGGHIDDSNWLGGHGYNGLAESYPYWLNGAWPMVVLLQNETGQKSIRDQMNFVFDRQDNASVAKGWLGPLVDGSPWSSFRFLVSLTQYLDATGDLRAARSMFTFATRLLDHLKSVPLGEGSWSQSRWQELLEGYQWLLDSKYSSVASEAQIADVWSLMQLASKQGFDWIKWVESDEAHPFMNISAGKFKPTAYILNHDISGDDLSASPLSDGSTHLDCEKMCNATKECVAYVFAPKGCNDKGDMPQNFCWLKSGVAAPVKQTCRNYRVIRNSSDDSDIHPWFPNNQKDADLIGYNHWLSVGLNRQWTHGVNLGQAMMTWGLMHRLTGGKEGDYIARGRKAWDKVMALHGQSTGVFTGDETLAGTAANRGTETCGVVEAMNAAAEQFAITGDPSYADQLERIAFNALPAAFFNGSMWTLNYFQQVNKLEAMDGEPNCEQGCTYCFGMVYECCVSNHAQGWPKFAARQITVASSGALAIMHYFSSSSTRPIALPGGVTIASLNIDTRYPFSDTIAVDIKSASGDFDMEVRIPAWATEATVNGKRAMPGMHKFPVTKGDSTIQIVLPMKIRVERRPATQMVPPPAAPVANNAATIHRGPLMYAVDRDAVYDHSAPFDVSTNLRPQGQFHGQNNYLLGTGEWRHAIVLNDDANPERELRFEERAPLPLPLGQGPFSAALVPGRIIARAVTLNATVWDLVASGRGAATACGKGSTSIPSYTSGWADLPPGSPVPVHFEPQEAFDIVLVPYGATNLRVGEIPTVRSIP